MRFQGMVMLLAVAGCAGGQLLQGDLADTGAGEVGTEDGRAATDRGRGDEVRGADEAHQPAELTAEAGTETLAGCQPGDGCFLDPCSNNGECLSEWCVEHMGDGVCTSLCQSECPPGWSCRQVAGTEPDMIFVCSSNHANLCKPCASGSDCTSPTGYADVCVDYGNEGSFCGGVCAVDKDCPWGFSCEDVLTVDGAPSRQCLAEAGVCPCTAKSAALSLWTPCEQVNEHGSCSGKRFCTQSGLTDCDALEPAAESCNGLDDDCDGQVDEPNQIAGAFVPLCDDGNSCSEDLCMGVDGCSHIALDGPECKDGDLCTVADHCVAGICVGSPVVCNDGNSCTDDLCDGKGGCLHPFNSLPCEDGDPCTVSDQCKAGECGGFQLACDCQADADCTALEVNNKCLGKLHCDQDSLPYKCAADPDLAVVCAPPPGPDQPCLVAACNPATGGCVVTAGIAGPPCDDGDPCTVGEKCGAGVCAGGLPANCKDGNPCTDDSCLALTGCLHSFNTAPCDDGLTCTVGEKCSLGQCSGGQPLSCNDANPCTDDGCSEGSGCTHAPNVAACDDGNPCTTGDQCQGGKCSFNGFFSCDDDNPCTKDLCIAGSGCQHTPQAGLCNDDNLCTTADLCQAGKCEGGALLTCSDGNPCTADSCDKVKGCVHSPTAGPCSDGNACTLGDGCSAGLCQPGALLDCNDGDPCTDNWCDPASGLCGQKLNKAPCNDEDLCTVNDHCHLGLCIGGGALLCDDGNDCTADSCLPAVGCLFAPQIVPCCTGGTVACGDLCVDTDKDFDHCGKCDSPCLAGEACVGGKCLAQCPKPLLKCGDNCVDPATDEDHCGDCDQPCLAGEVCLGGKCQPTCSGSQELCGDLCTNTAFDPDHCGKCFNPCPTVPNAAGVCVGGDCHLLCLDSWADCNLDMADGCEVHLLTDADHCNQCGVSCAAVANGTRGCVAGNCRITGCSAGYDDCDKQYGTGCEVLLAKNFNHCGECNKVCGVGQVCDGGVCKTQPTSFIVHATHDITYSGINYLLLKVGLASTTAMTENWCKEYQTLCESYGLKPTGCGYSWPSGGYETCRSDYGSKVYDSSLSCNPSGPIASAAQSAGYGDASGSNSFGFHHCTSASCTKILCSGSYCNSALSYIDASKSHGYTLCIK